MFLRNKLIISLALSMILILGACGNSEVGDDQTVYPDEETSSSEREATIDEDGSEQMGLSESVEDIIGSWKGINDEEEVETYLEFDEERMVIREMSDDNPESVEYILTETQDDHFILEVIDPASGSKDFLFEGYFENKDTINPIENSDVDFELIRVDNIEEDMAEEKEKTAKVEAEREAEAEEKEKAEREEKGTKFKMGESADAGSKTVKVNSIEESDEISDGKLIIINTDIKVNSDEPAMSSMDADSFKLTDGDTIYEPTKFRSDDEDFVDFEYSISLYPGPSKPHDLVFEVPDDFDISDYVMKVSTDSFDIQIVEISLTE